MEIFDIPLLMLLYILRCKKYKNHKIEEVFVCTLVKIEVSRDLSGLQYFSQKSAEKNYFSFTKLKEFTINGLLWHSSPLYYKYWELIFEEIFYFRVFINLHVLNYEESESRRTCFELLFLILVRILLNMVCIKLTVPIMEHAKIFGCIVDCE